MRRIVMLSFFLIIITAFYLINTKGKGVFAAISPDVTTIWTKVCSDDHLPSFAKVETHAEGQAGGGLDTIVTCYETNTNNVWVVKWVYICYQDNGFIVLTPGVNALQSTKLTVRCKIP